MGFTRLSRARRDARSKRMAKRVRAPPSVAPHCATVNIDRLARYPLAAIGDEETDYLGALSAVARIAQRDGTLDELLPAFAAAEVVHPECVDYAGADRVDAYTVRREVECHRAAQRVDSGLGSGIGGGLGRRDLAGDGGDIDDAAAVALGDHFARGGA